MTARRNIAKEAAARRASMAAHVSESFNRSGKAFTCDASLTYDDAMMTLAHGLAYAAIIDGLAFGNSASRRDPRHVAGLALSDAARLQSAQWLARRDAAKVAA